MKDKHADAFLQEAFELIEVLESSLLELESKPDDTDLISKVFRSLHTLKGGGGMFGFDDVAAFVHDIETVYDRIRNGELEVNHKIIDLTLKSCDRLSIMIKKEDGHSSIQDETAIQLLLSFKEFLPVKESNKQTQVQPDVQKNNSEPKTVYHIVFKPTEDLFHQGINPIGLLNELSELGNAIIIPSTQNIPDLENINPELFYTSWDVILSTEKGINSIKDVFIFVEDDCKISIDKIDDGELKGNVDYYLQIINKTKSKTEPINNIVKTRKEVKRKDVANNSSRENNSSIRVNSDKLDLLVNLVGELVTAQARLAQVANKNKNVELNSISEDVERLIWDLRENTLSIRMLPFGSTFSKFNRLVRDLSIELGKDIELVTEGGETEVDKSVIEKLNDPLIHIIRNCIDHGIESPELRVEKGKRRTGKILLSAVHSGTHVLIRIEDDGAGLNKEALIKKAVERARALGQLFDETKLTEKEICNLIFQPGLTTAKEITNVSGRGVGLDVVKTAIESLRGSIEVENKPGMGTSITLMLPLTLAIIEGLTVRIDNDYFVIPLSSVEECIELTPESKNRSNGRNILEVRKEVVPYISLREKFNINSEMPSIEQIVIVNENCMKIGLVVDEIIGERQTVIKTLGSYYKNIEEMSGATVMGDGTVALIIDVAKLISSAVENEKLLIGNIS